MLIDQYQSQYLPVICIISFFSWHPNNLVQSTTQKLQTEQITDLAVCNPSPTDCSKNTNLSRKWFIYSKRFSSICCNGKLTLLLRKYGHGPDFQFIWRASATEQILVVTDTPLTLPHRNANKLKDAQYFSFVLIFDGAEVTIPLLQLCLISSITWSLTTDYTVRITTRPL